MAGVAVVSETSCMFGRGDGAVRVGTTHCGRRAVDRQHGSTQREPARAANKRVNHFQASTWAVPLIADREGDPE